MLHSQNLLKGALLIVASETMFASMGATVKALAELGFANDMSVFMRNALGFFIVLPLLLQHGGVQNFKTQVWPLHLLRTVVGLGAMYCFFYTLAHLNLANGMLLKMTAPIFMPSLAYLWLHERAPRLALLAVPVGFSGVILIIEPGSAWSWTAAIGLLGGVLAAIAQVSLRKLSRTEPTTRIVLYFSMQSALISAIPLLWHWQTPTWLQWQLVLLLSLFGTLGQLLLTRGYASAPAAQVGPFTYFSVIFGAAYGYGLWGETLNWSFVGGALLIALAGILALQRARLRAPLAE